MKPAKMTVEKSNDDSGPAGALYEELRSAAHREFRRSGSPQTWQTTAIINEAWIKLHSRDDWESREHFVRTASTTMRHIMIDAARGRLAERRGGDAQRVPIEAASQVPDSGIADHMLVRLGDTLAELAELDPELARLVDCRFFAGLTEPEVAQVLGMSERTVRRRWVQARAWIHSELLSS